MAEGGAANSREAVVDAGAVEMLSNWGCVDDSRDVAAPVEPGLCREKRRSEACAQKVCQVVVTSEEHRRKSRFGPAASIVPLLRRGDPIMTVARRCC